jgi:NADPH2:quinone reductase
MDAAHSRTVKAVVCRALTGIEALRCERITPPQLHAGEVRIDVHAAGVNFPDILKARGLYQVTPALPWVPGAEVAGVVSEIGEGVCNVIPGERIMGVASAKGGGFAEQIVLSADRVFPIRQDMSFAQAAAIPVAYGTALYALKQRGELKPAEQLLVLGAAGGVGLAAVQLGKAIGARVIAAASTEEKRQMALAHGADDVVDYTLPGWRNSVLELTGSLGVDVIYDPVGGDVFDEAIRCTAWMGRYLVVGFSSGRIPSLSVNHPLVKGYDLRGVRYDVWRDRCWRQAQSNLRQVLDWCGEGRIRPHVDATYPLEQAVTALRSLMTRQAKGKIVLLPGE